MTDHEALKALLDTIFAGRGGARRLASGGTSDNDGFGAVASSMGFDDPSTNNLRDSLLDPLGLAMKSPQNTFQASVSPDIEKQNWNPAMQAALGQGQAALGQGQLAALQGQGTNMQQSALAKQFSDQAAGIGPSLAQLQLQVGTQANIQNAASQAASARGMSPALAQRLAMQNAAAANQNAAGQAAMTRLQEQRTAQQGLGDVLGQQRQAALASQGMANQLYGAANQLYGTNVGAFGQQNQTLAGAWQGAQDLNQKTAAANVSGQKGLLSGLMGGVGGGLQLAHGGQVRRFAEGTQAAGDAAFDSAGEESFGGADGQPGSAGQTPEDSVPVSRMLMAPFGSNSDQPAQPEAEDIASAVQGAGGKKDGNPWLAKLLQLIFAGVMRRNVQSPFIPTTGGVAHKADGGSVTIGQPEVLDRNPGVTIGQPEVLDRVPSVESKANGGVSGEKSEGGAEYGGTMVMGKPTPLPSKADDYEAMIDRMSNYPSVAAGLVDKLSDHLSPIEEHAARLLLSGAAGDEGQLDDFLDSDKGLASQKALRAKLGDAGSAAFQTAIKMYPMAASLAGGRGKTGTVQPDLYLNHLLSESAIPVREAELPRPELRDPAVRQAMLAGPEHMSPPAGEVTKVGAPPRGIPVDPTAPKTWWKIPDYMAPTRLMDPAQYPTSPNLQLPPGSGTVKIRVAKPLREIDVPDPTVKLDEGGSVALAGRQSALDGWVRHLDDGGDAGSGDDGGDAGSGHLLGGIMKGLGAAGQEESAQNGQESQLQSTMSQLGPILSIISMLDTGGTVPGKPPIPGKDSLRNDVVPALLTAKEKVIPQSITTAEHAPEKTAAFVAALDAGANPKKAKQVASGVTAENLKSVLDRLSVLEKKLKGRR